jgi:hypothetical protein
MSRHHDDRIAVEDRLAAAGCHAELAELYAASTLTGNRQPGVRAASLIERVEGHLETLDLAPVHATPLHLAAASAALSARRPEWFERGARYAIDHYRRVDEPEALGSALVVGSFMPALSDLDAALDMLREAREIADAAGATVVGTVALAYASLYWAVAGERARAIASFPVVEARLATDGYRYDRAVYDAARFVAFVLDEPRSALLATEQQRVEEDVDHWSRLVTRTCALAALGEVEETRSGVAETEASVRRSATDDGLPDLLVPLAILAWRVGDLERAMRWVTAIQRASRPTVNFLITGAYRQVRDRVGLLDEDPLESTTIGAVYREATEWLRGRGTDD